MKSQTIWSPQFEAATIKSTLFINEVKRQITMPTNALNKVAKES